MWAMTVLAMVGATALVGCGATRAPTVASVQGSSISQQELSHWMGIKRAELQSSSRPTSISFARSREKALAFLITAQWLEKEALAQGVSVSQTEVRATYHRLLSGLGGHTFAASLKRRGLSSADELLVLRLGALAQKLRMKIAASYHAASLADIRRRVSAFIAAYRQRWKRRTTCRPGYIIAECRNGPPLQAAPGHGP
jgi:hypothetical protein